MTFEGTMRAPRVERVSEPHVRHVSVPRAQSSYNDDNLHNEDYWTSPDLLLDVRVHIPFAGAGVSIDGYWCRRQQ